MNERIDAAAPGGVLALAALAASLASAFLLLRVESAYAWIFAVWCAFFVLVAAGVRRTGVRLVSVNLAGLCLLLCLAEVGLRLAHSAGAGWAAERFEGTYGQGYFVPDDVLGYAPSAGHSVSSSKFADERLVYRATYTIDADGLRVAPSCSAAAGAGSVLFFGCSSTFGEGVGDDQTFAYQVAALTGGAWCTYNFAFHGYGPHQMLAGLERGRVESIVKVRPRYAIYLGMHWHVARAAGHDEWDFHGPRYVLTQDGNVAYRGHFDDLLATRAFKKLRPYLHKSAILSRLLDRPAPLTDADIALYGAIVARSRRLLEAKYPGLEFHVLYWDEDSDDSARVQHGLEQRGLRVHTLAQILGLRDYERGAFKISPRYDHHPNVRCHRAMAEYILRAIVKRGTEAEGSATAPLPAPGSVAGQPAG